MVGTGESLWGWYFGSKLLYLFFSCEYFKSSMW